VFTVGAAQDRVTELGAGDEAAVDEVAVDDVAVDDPEAAELVDEPVA
jgi:hypothetical protein